MSDASKDIAPPHQRARDILNAPPWRPVLLGAVVGLTLLTVAFHNTVEDAVFLWWARAAYNHCFLILPIALFLLWDQRPHWLGLTPAPSYWGLGLFVLFGGAWLFATTHDIQEGQQFALIGLIQGLCLGLFGPHIIKKNLLAFAYLWLLVPSGAFLLPTMQAIATVQTVWWLDLASIPVFQDGFLLQTPGGFYVIAPGCAGMNFLLSALALTPLYGYLVYQSWKKRVAALAFMLILALIANGLRIFAIIALAEWTNSRIDIVDDHLVYGWGFFAFVLFAMGLIGLKFADPPPAQTDLVHTPAPLKPNAATHYALIVLGFVVISLSILVLGRGL